MNEIFYKLFSGGKYSLPYLLEFYHPNYGTICLVNNNKNITHNGNEYIASSFDYSQPTSDGSGGSLRITGIDNTLLDFIEKADDRYELTVTGVLIDEKVQEIKSRRHFFGSVSYTDNMTLDFMLGSDDRLDMVFPPYMYDTENNKGNA